MATETLISSHPSTSGLQIALHPLALLTISDYITRHTLRQGKGPIVGALLGAQNGRDLSIEHAYEVVALQDADGKQSVEPEWFNQKLELCESAVRCFVADDNGNGEDRMLTSPLLRYSQDYPA